MEHSSNNFQKVAPHYIHRSLHTLNSGADVNFLTNYIYISLDTFHTVSQNIDSYLDAWFTFLSSDSPDDILHLIQNYPEFKEYYHDIALFRTRPEELMTMYSDGTKNALNFGILKNNFEKFSFGERCAPGKMGEYVKGKYNCAISGAWADEKTFKIMVQVIDQYFGCMDITISFKDHRCTLFISRSGQYVFEEINGYVIGEMEEN